MTCLNGLNTPYIIQRSRREKSSLALCCLLARIRNITVNVSVFFFKLFSVSAEFETEIMDVVIKIFLPRS